MPEPLDSLVAMTQTIGQPHMNYVIIGEGNTSCRIDDESFYIKASGQQMNSITPEGFVAVKFAPIMEMLDGPELPLDAQKQVAQAACVDQSVPVRPSIEVTFHAMLIAEFGVEFIGHAHPVEINKLLCSSRAEQFAYRRIFPDQVTLSGPDSPLIPYADPGMPLAHAIRDGVRNYVDRQGELPKIILLKNHGVIVLGETPSEVLNVMAMTVKAAAIFAGACAVGEPVFMTEDDVYHIHRRPDELYRRQQFVETHRT